MATCDMIIRDVQWQDRSCDLLLAEGRILELAEAGAAAPEGARSIEARGLHLLPSLIDAHVHLREPGQEY